MITRTEIESSLKEVPGLYVPGLDLILFRIACHESHLGRHVIQVGGGPAKGAYQMEGETHDDLWDNYLKYNPVLQSRVIKAGYVRDVSRLLEVPYATVMAGLQVRRKYPKNLINARSVELHAEFWKKYWNTSAGKGTVEKFIDDVGRYEK